MTPKQREKMLDELVAASIEAYAEDRECLEDALRNGWKGYTNLTDEELLNEWGDIPLPNETQS